MKRRKFLRATGWGVVAASAGLTGPLGVWAKEAGDTPGSQRTPVAGDEPPATPGCAMTASEGIVAGTASGKTLEPLETGTGLITMVVMPPLTPT